ncbi:agmatine deiminase family protein, partial [Streptomyces sp. NPDC059556]|uniref:agmatine deiminase family protein n=1 Tax=Streptomyces sp. NPDC059556 TaxID=3346863 RepID=UPI003677BE49
MSHPSPTRRTTLRALAGIGGALAFGAAGCGPGDSTPSGATGVSTSPATGSARPSSEGGDRRFGAEWDSHTRTFMSWPALASVWGDELPSVREDIARIARAVAGYEAVVMMARPAQVAAAQRACGSDVEVIAMPGGVAGARPPRARV